MSAFRKSSACCLPSWCWCPCWCLSRYSSSCGAAPASSAGSGRSRRRPSRQTRNSSTKKQIKSKGTYKTKLIRPYIERTKNRMLFNWLYWNSLAKHDIVSPAPTLDKFSLLEMVDRVANDLVQSPELHPEAVPAREVELRGRGLLALRVAQRRHLVVRVGATDGGHDVLPVEALQHSEVAAYVRYNRVKIKERS